jgi:hypothetical protein
MKFEFLIWTSLAWSPGFSRIGRSPQYAAAPAGIHRLMKFEQVSQLSPDWSPGFSRIRLSRQYALAPAGIHRLKPGLQIIAYPDYVFKLHQPDQAFPAVCRGPGRYPPANEV